MKLIRTNIWLRQDHQQKLKAMSKKSGEAVSVLIRTAIEDYLKSKK